MKIRRARPEDAETLARAEQMLARTPGRLVSRPHEIKPAAFRRSIIALKKTGFYVVAQERGQVVGHAFLAPMAERESMAHVFRLTIMVHEGQQRRGIGTALMNHLMDWARRDPRCVKIELGVRAMNRAAIRLYRKLGFVVEGRLRKRVKLPDGRFTDDFLMAWFPDRAARP